MNKSSIHAQQVLSTCHNAAFVNPKKTDSLMLTIESQINLCDFFSYTLYIYKVKEKRAFDLQEQDKRSFVFLFVWLNHCSDCLY